MRPDRLVLLAEERIGIEAVGVKCAQAIVFNAFSGYWMVIADWDLGEDVIRLDGHEDVVRRCVIADGCSGCSITEVGEDVVAVVSQCARTLLRIMC